tara:strand:+ start:52 stop:1350 length:1299 start_codon:yes stop_codon:yes gene_type:complete
MIKKIKNISKKIDNFFYKKFKSYKTTKYLENIKEAHVIFSCINKNENENKIRFVGGCVRKALNGESIDDIDLATTLEPDEVKIRLAKESIRVIDTGIKHGTVTAVINKKKFEITTLRKDIATDGRHADIEFTLSWDRDSSRRDFTINSIYADIDGRIFDPQNGISDLRDGKIIFIGFPEERIQEDYLRILRYFRFFTQYSKIEHDQNTILSIKKHINGINKISNERIFDELNKMIVLKNFSTIFSNKNSRETLLNIFPQFIYYERLEKFNKINNSLKKNFDNCLILAILIMDHSNNYEYFCHKYKTSNVIKNRLKNLSNNFEKLKDKNFYTKNKIKRLIYLSSKESVIDLLLFSISLNNKIDISIIEDLIKYTNNCKIPKFPISGEYLKIQGYKAGKLLGKRLKDLEEKWIENDFIIEKKFLEKSLEKINKN